MGGSKDNSQKTAAAGAANQNQTAGAAYDTAAQNLYGNVNANTEAMANPNSVSTSAPLSGAYLQQYNQSVANTAQQYQNASGQLASSMNLRGFGANSPSGMGASLQGQLSADEANAQGQNFTNATTNQYNTALQNFWNANQLQSSAAGQQGQLGMTGGSTAANTYANLYANSYQPSLLGSIAGGAASAFAGGLLGGPAGLGASAAKAIAKA